MGDFKVKCTKPFAPYGGGLFTKDKTYEIKNSKLIDDNGHMYLGAFENVEQVNKEMASQFELVEDKVDFRVRCTSTNKANKFMVGKVYEVKNGCIVAECGHKFEGWSNCGKNANYETFSKWWNDDKYCSHFELVTEPKQFTKADLKTGMRVERADGTMLLVVKGYCDKNHGVQDVCFINEHNFYSSKDYRDDLTKARSVWTGSDIVKVYDSPEYGSNFYNLKRLGKLLYQRTEPTKYTISEAQTKLSEFEGKEIEIVEG